MEMDPSFVCAETGLLLESKPRPKPKALTEIKRKNKRQPEDPSAFFKLRMHSTVLIYSSISLH